MYCPVSARLILWAATGEIVADTDYNLDSQIRSEWDYLKRTLEKAFMVTIFGYSALVSDTSAVDALKGAWGENALGEMNQVEIIDIRDETALRSSWREFIRFDHYEVHSCFYESWIADNSPNPQLPTCSQEIPQQNTGCTIPWDEESRHGIKQSHRSLQAATLNLLLWAGAKITSVFSLHGFDGVVPFGEEAVRCDA